MKNNKVALFDFDGTLTRKDSFTCFILFSLGRYKYYSGLLLLSPILLLYKLKLVNNSTAKQIVLTYFFKGCFVDQFENYGKNFAKKVIPELLRKDGLERLKMHIENGHRVIIITASPEDWIKSW